MPARVAVLKILRMAALLAVAGCMSPSSAAVSTPAFQQLIIKFKPNTVTCDAAGIAQLSTATQVQLEFFRTMSGDACVIRQSAESEDALTQGQEVLRQHPAVELLEQDRRMKAL